MKIKSYHILFHIFSYLADKTNGVSFFVKYKLLIGTIIVGFTTTSCNRSKNTITCYDMSAPYIDSLVVSNQDTIPQQQKDSSGNTVIKPEIPDSPEPFITCYDTIHIIPEPILEPEVSCYIIIEPEAEEVFSYGTTEIAPVSAQGDINDFMNWVLNNLQYPEKMIANNEQGKVAVSFIIDTEGNLTNIEILRSFSEEANKEVIRVLSSSSKWTPGEHKGQKVKVKVTFPVTFRLPQ